MNRFSKLFTEFFLLGCRNRFATHDGAHSVYTVGKPVFETLLIFGAAGFLVMTMLGLSHGQGAGHGHGHSSHGGSMGSADSPASMSAGHHGVMGSHSHGPAHAPTLDSAAGYVASVKAPIVKGATPKLHAKAAGAHGGGGLAQQLKSVALMFISPLDIFSISLGMGMAGILLRQFLAVGTVLTVCAFVVGFIFNLVVTRGLLRLAMRFAAEPCEGLEGMVNHPGKATTAFGRDGKGVIEICMDGQTSQVLATLDNEERSKGVTVRKGDVVIILDVDPRRNVCRVSRDLAPIESEAGVHT